MYYWRALKEKHVVVPVDEVVAVVVPFFEEISKFGISHFLHIQWYFTRPRLHDFTEIVPVFELEEFEVDKFFEGSGYIFLVVDEVEQVESKLVEVACISLSEWGRRYFTMALP